MSEIDKFKTAFNSVRDLGQVRGRRSGNTNIGKTLEDIMGVSENNIDAPDLHGFEIKSQRELSKSYVTLFTKVPTYPRGVNNYLRTNYGTSDVEFSNLKVLHTSFFQTRWNTPSASFSYKLERDDANQKLFILVKKNMNNIIVENNIYWDYNIIISAINRKLNNLAFVQAITHKINDIEYFTFQNCTLYSGLTLESFLAHITNGSIMFDIRIGVYKNPDRANYGKTHDHGSCFRIRPNMLQSLYSDMETI